MIQHPSSSIARVRSRRCNNSVRSPSHARQWVPPPPPSPPHACPTAVSACPSTGGFYPRVYGCVRPRLTRPPVLRLARPPVPVCPLGPPDRTHRGGGARGRTAAGEEINAAKDPSAAGYGRRRRRKSRRRRLPVIYSMKYSC